MDKKIFKSYNYSLFTNYKKENIRKMIDSLTYGEEMLEMSTQDILSLLIVDQEDILKNEMSLDDIYTFLRYAGLDSLTDEGSVELELLKVPSGVLGEMHVYDSSELMEMLKLLAKKRVSSRFNIANVLFLSTLFKKYKDFDIDVVTQLLYGEDENYSLYEKDKYLVLDSMKRESKIAMDNFLQSLKFGKAKKSTVDSDIYIDFGETTEGDVVWNDSLAEDDYQAHGFNDSEDTYQYQHRMH